MDIPSLDRKFNKLFSQFDSLVFRVSTCENSTQKCIAQFNDKQDKKEFDELQNEFRNFSKQVKQQLLDCVTLDRFEGQQAEIQRLNKAQKQFVTKQELYDQLTLFDTKTSFVAPQVQQAYQPQPQHQQPDKRVTQLLQEVDTLKFMVQQNGEHNIRTFEDIYQNLDNIKQILKDKMVIKEEIIWFQAASDNLTLEFSQVKKKVDEDIAAFQAIINRFDYEILFKASKMDCEELKIAIETSRKQILENLHQKVTLLDKALMHKLQEEAQELKKTNQDSLKQFLNSEASLQIKQELQSYMKNLRMEDLKDQLDEIKSQLDTKAPLSQLNNFELKKQSKTSAEHMAQYNVQLQQYLKLSLRHLLTFISLFDCQESINMKKADIRKSFMDIQNLVDSLAQLRMTDFIPHQISKRGKSFTYIEQSPQNSPRSRMVSVENSIPTSHMDSGRLSKHKNQPIVKLKPLLTNRNLKI